MLFSLASTLALAGGSIAATCGSGDLDLSKWTLQLPTGSTGKPKQVSASSLCAGYKDDNFYMSGSALVMKVPGAPPTCVTTPNSKHCRTELRESNPSSFDPKASVNRLSAELQAVKNDGSVCIGQIHIDDSVSVKPVAELYYESNGDLALGIQTCRTCGQIKGKPFDNVPKGTKFSYEIRYESSKLQVSINGKAFQTFDASGVDSPKSYFKAGNYNQGSGATEIHFFKVNTVHG